MKMDEAEREKCLQEMFERSKRMNDLTLATLRSHLTLEQIIGDYLLEKGVKAKWVRKNMFAKKTDKAKALAQAEGDKGAWEIIELGNQLRNTIAHSLSTDRIERKVEQLREKYVAWLPERPAADAAKAPADRMTEDALLTCAGFVATLTDRARGAKAAG